MKHKLLSLVLVMVMVLSLAPSITMNVKASDSVDMMVSYAQARIGRSGAELGYNDQWCAYFVCDCAAYAGESAAVPYNGSAHWLYFAVLNAGGQVVNSPQAGDLVFYNCSACDTNGDNISMDHVGLVENQYYSIEGNLGSAGSTLYTRTVRRKGLTERFSCDGHSTDDYISRVYVRPAYAGYSHEVDSSYGTNFTTYPKAEITAENIFNANHVQINSTSKIYTSDLCTIHEVYTDGCCKVTYPLDGGGTKTVYSKISLFKPLHTHNYTGTRVYESAHPHEITQRCVDYATCGGWIYTGEYYKAKDCEQCWYATINIGASSVSVSVGESKTISLSVTNGCLPDSAEAFVDFVPDNGVAEVTIKDRQATFTGLKAGTTNFKLSIYNDSSKSHLIASITIPITVTEVYTVSYDANGGTGAPDDQSKYHDETLTLSSTKPTRPGYTFLGWSLSGSATKASYQPGGNYAANESVTLYAVWKKVFYGDVNRDGKVTSIDMLYTARMCDGLEDGTEWAKITGDVNGDGSITSADTEQISLYINNKIAEFPVEAMVKQFMINSVSGRTRFYIGDEVETASMIMFYSQTSVIYDVTEYCDFTLPDTSTAGEKNVLVTFQDYSNSYSITIVKPSVILSEKSIAMIEGQSQNLTAVSDPSGQIITWSSSDTAVATVSNGTITAKSVGTATIYAKITYKGSTYQTKCSVTVNSAPKPTTVTIVSNPTKTTYYIGDSLSTSGLKLLVTYSDGSTKTITSGFTTSGFSSSTAGTKTVTVSYEGFTDTFTVAVKTPSITLSSSSKTLTVGDSSTITASTTPSGQSVTWTSSNTSVATVFGGTITAKSAGSATITAKFTYNGIAYSATCNVTVKAPTLTKIEVASNPTKTVYEIGESLNTSGLKLKLTYSNDSTETITGGFTTSGFSSATAGTKTVTVTYGDLTATFAVTVTAPAVDENMPQIVVESKKLTKGSEFTVAVEIKNNPGFSYLEVTPQYDSALTLVKVENGELISDFTKGKQYVWVSDEDVTEDGLLMTFTFSTAEDLEAGNYPVSFQVRTCANYDEQAVSLTVVPGNIEVIDFVYGDATGDGAVDGFDVIRLKKYLANYDYDTETSTVEIGFGADANGDGKVDGFDVIRLKKYLADYDYETGESSVVLGPK